MTWIARRQIELELEKSDGNSAEIQGTIYSNEIH